MDILELLKTDPDKAREEYEKLSLEDRIKLSVIYATGWDCTPEDLDLGQEKGRPYVTAKKPMEKMFITINANDGKTTGTETD